MSKTESLALFGVVATTFGVLLDAYLDKNNRDDREVCSQAEYLPCKKIFKQKEYDELQTSGIVVIDNAVTKNIIREISQTCKYMAEKKIFKSNGNEDDEIRQDKVVWVRDCPGGEGVVLKDKNLLHALRTVRGIAKEIQNFSVQNGPDMNELSVPRRAQLAMYTKGGGYLAHRDACNATFFDLGLYQWFILRQYRERKYTAILYLNDHDLEQGKNEKNKQTISLDEDKTKGQKHVFPSKKWDVQKDGGSLRCYVGANSSDDIGTTADKIIDVEPEGGRLVIFDSRMLLHQVMPSQRSRLALTVWIESST
mmetsp:Transcript_27574/g.36167  ORF Transcript_27574/g.36167 Transcript_27574/m.36167 type:complete len:309 (-) Transcript_27574:154-1080(-)